MNEILWVVLGGGPFIAGLVAGMRIEEFSLTARERRLAKQRRTLNERRRGGDRIAA